MADEKSQYPSNAAPKFIIRLPPGMRDRIAESARANNRSMNAEVIARLEQGFNAPHEPYATMTQLERVLGKIAREQDRVMMGVSLLRDMLGAYVREMFPRLSKEDQASPTFQSMRDLATASIEMDAEGIREAAKKIMAGQLSADLGDPTEFFEYLGQVNKAASERRQKMLDADDAPKGDDSKKP